MVVEWAPLVGLLIAVVARVMELAGTARRYRRKCQLLQGRVLMIDNHLRQLQASQYTLDPPATQDALQCLRQVLDRAEELVLSCQRKKKAFDFLRALKNTGEFDFVDKRIGHIMESFHLSNRALILGLYNDRIFMVVLDTLVKDGACRLLSQDRKEEMETAINELTSYGANMPPEKKKMLEVIKSELRQGSNRRQCDAVGRGGRGQNDCRLLQDVDYIASFAKKIVGEADVVKHNKEEVQRVARLAQQVVYLLPHLQSPQLTRHSETGQLVDNLRYDLEGALETIKSRPLQCGGPAAVMTSSFWRQQAKAISELGNRIEKGFQRLTFIVMRQIMNNA